MAETKDSADIKFGQELAEDEDEEDEKVLEVSKNKRWNKMSLAVSQREVPGTDAAYLAIDTDEGMEVVWNEVRYSQRKTQKQDHRERLSCILNKLINIKHRNIVTFYDFWLDKDSDNQDRLVFITEYMTSGSLLQFLKTKRRNTLAGDKAKKANKETPWKRWCRQILSALCYLHKKEIIHGNLTLGTIFIQHDGLVKIGAVSPDAIHQHVKTKSEETRWLHYIAPEYAGSDHISSSSDMYSFGICVLEMMKWNLLDGDHHLKPETIKKALDGLDPTRKSFVAACLNPDPDKRPTAGELVKSSVLWELHNLRTLSGIRLPKKIDGNYMRSVEDKLILSAEVGKGDKVKHFKGTDKPPLDYVRFLEDIRCDFYYLFEEENPIGPPPKELAAKGIETGPKKKKKSYDPEPRRIQSVTCEIKSEADKKTLHIRILLEDKMKRNVTTELIEGDNAEQLARDLVLNGLLNENDYEEVNKRITERLRMPQQQVQSTA